MTDDWHATRERHNRFAKTELGRLFIAYNNACIAYWRMDLNETISNKRLVELDVAAKAAEKTFKDKLMELAGV